MEKATCIDGDKKLHGFGQGQAPEGSSPGTGEPGDRFAAA